jgi:hypothetical protein
LTLARYEEVLADCKSLVRKVGSEAAINQRGRRGQDMGRRGTVVAWKVMLLGKKKVVCTHRICTSKYVLKVLIIPGKGQARLRWMSSTRQSRKRPSTTQLFYWLHHSATLLPHEPHVQNFSSGTSSSLP